jgi:predicted RNase H-like HicB family nuclease
MACGEEGERMRPQDYEVRIRPLSEEEGGGFLAEVTQLPGCMSDGETPQEALDHVYDAIVCWMEAAKEMGRAVPEPKRAVA